MKQALSAGDLCTRAVTTVPGSLAIDEAARVMRESHVGSLVVVAPGERGLRPIGMLTDRDIVTAVVARNVDPASLRVADVMTGDLATAGENDSALDVLAQMRRHAVRRVPVVGAHGELAGLVALDDVLEMVTEELQEMVAVIAGGLQRERYARP